ncbi:DUF983 domain-containing protein [Shumkonia mesophila]|uniref:DUF983 domain-containing protein n=1 Tax=Shumkonia mesophila TaxID=2838854 RepID=UPI002934B0E7|nr:DUF983 domain-containing protein [Shumkonia mesophila]
MTPTPPLLGLLLRGLRGRCPRCGEGRLFDGYLQVAGECPACRLNLAEHDAGDGPAVAATFILGAGIVGPAAFLELTVAPPLWVHAVLWGPLVIAGTLAVLRPLKGITVALQYRYRGLDEPPRLGGL